MTTISARCHHCHRLFNSHRRTFRAYEKWLLLGGWTFTAIGHTIFRVCPECTQLLAEGK